MLGKDYTGSKDVHVTSLKANDAFGSSVALNAAGDRLAVGAYADAGNGNVAAYSGAVRLFSFADTNFNGVTLQATLGKGYTGGKNVDVTSLETGDQFGISLALNAAGDRLAVGARGDAGNGNVAANSGAVHLFGFTDTTFTGGSLQATLGLGYTGGKNVGVSSLEAGDQFGTSVALNAAGDRLAVGAHFDDGNGNTASDSGAVRLFSFTDTGFAGGSLQATLGKGYTGGKNVDVSSLEANDEFGVSVALNAAGNQLAVGARYDDGNANLSSNSGAVHLFSFTDSNFTGGSLQATLGKGYTGVNNVNVSSLDAGDSFGNSVALNAAGDRLAIGAFGDDGSGSVATDSGAVYVFSAESGSGPYPGRSLSYGAHAEQSLTVSAADLRAQLASGASVTLQASNDITVNSTVAAPVGSTGGALSLQAGRSIAINADLRTQGGNLTLTANDTAANGVVDAYRAAGPASITMADGTTLDAGTGSVSISVRSGAGNTHNTPGDITLASINAASLGVDSVNLSATALAGNKVYDGNTSATLGTPTVIGLAFTASSNLLRPAVTASFADKNAGTAKTVTSTPLQVTGFNGAATSNLLNSGAEVKATGSADISAKAVSVAGMATSGKVYDGTTAAALTGGAVATGIAGEALGLTGQTGTFADKNAGAGKPVTVTGTTLADGTGGLASNYILSAQPIVASADISAKAMSVAGMAASGKVYDGTTAAALTGGAVATGIAGEALGLTGQTGTFADKNAGAGKPVTVTGTTLADGTGGLASN
ncbi:S-layer family protein [Polaromonas sp. CG_9.11]|uniref:beta strand repeat-containing protein n=1 Tax=Polaromonas sp. CG_9.11 TaxID=2787730 RepID=UPI0018C9E7C0|nr:YDG domain-containing protein [Polaromonas sp. CG_9.11]MBG6077856.1 hypothetical protein [Polaromonas sp. CG_9.11]